MLSLSPNSCAKYFKSGSVTRRHSVIGCLGYENANPMSVVETAEIGVGTNDNDDVVVCAVCLDVLNLTSGSGPQKNIATTQCGHTYCLSCLLKNLHTSNLCPLCRAPVEEGVKKVLKPLSYSEGIQLLNHELNGLQIYEDVEQYVQHALEISTQPNTNGENVQDVIDGVVNMVTNFGFNLLFDATLQTNGGEEQNMDQEWIINMYNYNSGGGGGDDSDDSNSTNNDYNNSDSDSDSDSHESSIIDDDSDQEEEDEHNNHQAIVLPEIPDSML
jgi:hypothetical protein